MQDFFELMISIRDEMRTATSVEDSDLSGVEISIMRTLARFPQLTQKELAERTGKHKSQVTRAFKSLAEKGLVKKTTNPEDGRSFLVETCAHVEPTLKGIIAAEDALITRLLHGFSKKETQQMENLVGRMLDNIRKKDN